ncbi:MAG: ATP phosphoribosyltransferase regulatory subunit [Gammaproteobacteria bacterium]|nr:MAG: ATP phosphoribosyltransferase regulatory subunit [Gammaproteobacteria bacterium]
MAINDRWLLPQGIEEALPDEAACLESMRRKLLDVYAGWGYQLVMPPFIEYLESLLTGTGHELSLQTFQIIDQLTGRAMGVRADMTPQVARIDAHQLKKEVPTRLCYMGTVLQTRPDGFGGSRSPLQVGAELYGHAGVDSDVEIISLMLETFRQSGVKDVVLDLGHVGIYGGLAQQAGLDSEQEADLFEMLQRKAIPEIQAFVGQLTINDDIKTMLLALAELHGGDECLDRAEQVLAKAQPSVKQALQYLKQAVGRLRQRVHDVHIHFDLAELRGYHTGIVFAAYVPGQGQAIARGGRYDDIGKVFGRARPATGFSTDLKTLVDLSAHSFSKAVSSAIFAPHGADAALAEKVAELRTQGETVIEELPGQQGDARAMGCDRILVQQHGQWSVESIKNG